jgi:hypothetical protein
VFFVEREVKGIDQWCKKELPVELAHAMVQHIPASALATQAAAATSLIAAHDVSTITATPVPRPPNTQTTTAQPSAITTTTTNSTRKTVVHKRRSMIPATTVTAAAPPTPTPEPDQQQQQQAEAKAADAPHVQPVDVPFAVKELRKLVYALRAQPHPFETQTFLNASQHYNSYQLRQPTLRRTIESPHPLIQIYEHELHEQPCDGAIVVQMDSQKSDVAILYMYPFPPPGSFLSKISLPKPNVITESDKLVDSPQALQQQPPRPPSVASLFAPHCIKAMQDPSPEQQQLAMAIDELDRGKL